MPAVKITKASNVEFRWNGAGNSALETVAGLLVQSGQHRVRCLADRNDKDAAIRIQVVQVFANSENTPFTLHVSCKGLADGRFAQGVAENVECHFFHSGGLMIS